MQAVRLLAPNVKGAITNTSLLAALRAQKKPINVEGFLNWRPGVKGPAALPRWNIMQNYFVTIKERQGRLVGQGPAPDRPDQGARLRSLGTTFCGGCGLRPAASLLFVSARGIPTNCLVEKRASAV